MIERPARDLGLVFASGLVDAIVADARTADPSGRAIRSTVLPLLEFALTQLWERRVDGELTHDAYRAMGGVTGGLSQWADRAYYALDHGQREIAKRVFKELVTLGDRTQDIPDTRRVRNIAESTKEDTTTQTNIVINTLVAARLLVARHNESSQQDTIEIIHNTLLFEWDLLRSWLDGTHSLKASSFVETKEGLFIESTLPLSVLNDQSKGEDKLNFSRYAKTFADLITNPELIPPIVIGIYGAWGSGKSFSMEKIKDETCVEEKTKWYDARGKIREFQRKTKTVNLHVIEFNAWVYSGSEHLWASLVTHLYRDIEKHFGFKAHSLRLRKALRKSLPKTLGVFAFYAIIGFLLSIIINFDDIESSWNSIEKAIATTFLGGSALASLPVLWASLREFFDNLFLSRANKLKNLAKQPDFRQQIGVMADIKDEIKFLHDLLKKGKNGKPTRLVLIIDDLDRCEHRKAVEVLQAIMLLLADEDGAPFIILLGIDARVIVRAIEEHYGSVLVNAGINGYEYLDKIIQIPFVIPYPTDEDVRNYVSSMLYSSEKEREEVEKLISLSRETEAQSNLLDGERKSNQKGNDATLPSKELSSTNTSTQSGEIDLKGDEETQINENLFVDPEKIQ